MGRYQAKLAEIQVLNGEMARANDKLDFDTVNSKGKEALGRAGEAREIAGQVTNPEVRARVLAEVGKISNDLEHLVRITGG